MPTTNVLNWNALNRLIQAVCLVCPVVFLAELPVAVAQNVRIEPDEVLVLERISGPVLIDGRIDDAGWSSLTPLPLTTHEPVFEDPMTEATEIRVGYDDQFLYVAGKLYDSEPENIRANSMYRDLYSGDDTFAIILDTFNDHENGLWFMTTPNGVRLDWAVFNDLQGGGSDPFGRVINQSWNTYWDAATSRNDQGWFAEIRIPFSSLGFQDQNGRVEMGLSVHRYISRKNERHVFPAIPPNWTMAFAKPSLFQRVRLDNASSRRPLYITPYTAGGLSSENVLNEEEALYDHDNDMTSDIGVDVKYNVTNNMTLDLTVNTDFAQAEADDEQVNLTRFSLFVPEKRQFFQERAGIFEFRTQGRYDRLFHTRQIGLYEGEAIPIIGGGRLVGRAGAWDLGVINLQTARSSVLPSENFGVYRLRRRVFNANSYAGALVTTRLGADGSRNVAYGMDGIIRVADREYLELKWAQTFGDDSTYSNSYRPDVNGYGRARLERRGDLGLSYIASVTWEGPEFNPGIGFVSRNDFVQPFGRLKYGWFAKESSPVRLYQPGVFSQVYLRNEDGSLESARMRHDWDLQMKSGDMHTFDLEYQYEDLLEPVEFPEDTEVPAGKYNYYVLGWQYQMRDGNLIRTNARVSAGSFFDGWNVEIQAEPTWNVTRMLELGAVYQFNRVRFPDRNQEFYVHLARLKAQLGFTTKVSVSSFLQYNTANDALSANFRFRYNFREGNDLWVVYNEGRHTDRFRERPVLPHLERRTVLLKYTYTFIR